MNRLFRIALCALGIVLLALAVAKMKGIRQPLNGIPSMRTVQMASSVRAVLRPSITLLDSSGRLTQPLPPISVTIWKNELHKGTSAERAAKLQLWLGEYAMTLENNPQEAGKRFLLAEKFSSPRSDIHGIAMYDDAILSYFRAANHDAVTKFKKLVDAKEHHGYSPRFANLWYRTAGSVAAYHQDHAKLGIPEPAATDPLCVAAGFSKLLESIGFRHDRACFERCSPRWLR